MTKYTNRPGPLNGPVRPLTPAEVSVLLSAIREVGPHPWATRCSPGCS